MVPQGDRIVYSAMIAARCGRDVLSARNDFARVAITFGILNEPTAPESVGRGTSGRDGGFHHAVRCPRAALRYRPADRH
jgi:hypothetical protein